MDGNHFVGCTQRSHYGLTIYRSLLLAAWAEAGAGSNCSVSVYRALQAPATMGWRLNLPAANGGFARVWADCKRAAL